MEGSGAAVPRTISGRPTLPFFHFEMELKATAQVLAGGSREVYELIINLAPIVSFEDRVLGILGVLDLSQVVLTRSRGVEGSSKEGNGAGCLHNEIEL